MSETIDRVKSELRAYVTEKFALSLGARNVEEVENWFKEGVIDSFGLVELIAFAEEKFAIEFSDEDLSSSRFISFLSTVEFVSEKLAAQG